MASKMAKMMDRTGKTSLFDHGKAYYVAQTAPAEFKHICVAVEKATNSDVCGPKEKHVQTLLEVVRGGASIADVTFLVKYLNRQIVDCAKWQTMLKTHILLHRLLHNSGDEFKDQLRRMQKWVEEDRATDSRIKCMFSIRNWRDDSNVDANELSQWTRSYAAYLEECVVNLDKIPRLDKLAAGSGIQGSQPTELRSCDEQTLMEKLPRIQNLMRRLLDCEAVNSNLTTNDAVISGISLLLKDSFKLYRLVNDGIIRLIDVFFTMTKLHAVKALDAYKRATQQGDDLERLFRSCNQWPSFRETKFPHIENPPASFMQTMEEYARTAPVESGEGGVGVSPGAAPPAPPAQQQQQAPVPQPAPVQTMPLEDLMGGFTAPAPQQTSPHTQQPAAPQVSPLNHFAAAGAQIAAANSLVDAFAAPAKHYSPPPAQQQPVAVAPPQPAAPAPVQPAGDIFGMEKPAMPMDLNALYDAPQPQANNPFGGATGGYGMAPTPGTGIGSFQAVPGQTPPHMMGGQGQMQQMGMGQQMPHMGTQMPQMQQQMGGMQQPQQQYGGMGMQQPQQMGQPAYGMPQMQQQPQMGQPQQQQQQQNNPFM